MHVHNPQQSSVCVILCHIVTNWIPAKIVNYLYLPFLVTTNNTSHWATIHNKTPELVQNTICILTSKSSLVMQYNNFETLCYQLKRATESKLKPPTVLLLLSSHIWSAPFRPDAGMVNSVQTEESIPPCCWSGRPRTVHQDWQDTCDFSTGHYPHWSQIVFHVGQAIAVVSTERAHCIIAISQT